MLKRISLLAFLSAIFAAVAPFSATAQQGHDANISASSDAADYAALPDAPEPSGDAVGLPSDTASSSRPSQGSRAPNPWATSLRWSSRTKSRKL